MASSSLSTRNWVYHVFPSFSGKDVRKRFLSHFLRELDRKLIISFKDEKMDKSESLDPVLRQAIKDSKIAIVIFSPNYASSSWCLNELLEIVKCKEEFGQIVIPVFYDLDPSHVRHQIGDFGENFKNTCRRKTEDEIQLWRDALREVASLVGFHSENCSDEAKMVEEISSKVLGKLNLTTSKDFEEFVGMEVHTATMRELLRLESEEVMMAGIWGPSGIGKTTIARALFQRFACQFQTSVFIDKAFISRNMEIYTRDDYSMKLNLQGNFLSEILGIKDIRIDHLGAVGDMLKNQKVLIVIDDLDDQVVLDALAGQCQWFGSGSRIIVVTTDKHLLTVHGIEHIYEVDLPNDGHALEILCRSAFKQNSPPEGFEKLAVEVTRYAGKLPLGLNVLGSSLRGRNKEYWMDMLPRLRNSLDGKIEKTLKVSYDGLGSEEDKLIFRHLACLFSSERFEFIKLLLADSNLGVNSGLENLVDKSLIYMRGSYVEMHRLLQEMGRKIVRMQSIDEPGRREFLVEWKDICDVLNENTGTKKVLGISLNIDDIDELNVHENAFKGMCNLRFLNIYRHKYSEDKKVRLHLPKSFDYLPSKLKELCWFRYPMRSMPANFRPENLVKLKMQDSNLEKLWEGVVPLTCLKEMDLSKSVNLKEIPDLSLATILETLKLNGCSSLVDLPSSIRTLDKQTDLIMYNCTNLKTLPTEMNLNVGDVSPSLETLCLSDIPSLVELPSSFRNFHKLKELRIRNCINLERLPNGINLQSLFSLDLSGCSRLRIFPNISTNIRQLNLDKTGIEEVPWWIEKFFKLKNLSMSNCSSFEYASLNISKLKHLWSVSFSHCGALSRVDLSGNPRWVAIEAGNIDKELTVVSEEASYSFIDNNYPKLMLFFINCFNLDQEALLQQPSVFQRLIFSGEEVPLYFTHRTIGPSSLAIALHLCPLVQPLFRFRVCLAAVPTLPPNVGGIDIDIKVKCRFKGKLGNYIADPYHLDCRMSTNIGSHVQIFDLCIPLNKDNPPLDELNYDQVDIKLHIEDEKYFVLKGWGIRILEDCSSAEYRLWKSKFKSNQ